ncbi:fructosamine-3-kinase [Anaerolinea thermolimosa]|uniref:fructosamine kinase family protein n=1 Tax=Anaerolinea thermolimosa TaxID=229919 RepID=UPI0007846213|nr:fructosamine kinase family protein [Anaerolinea thermolimosa]GAP06710.1 fructosamine-3-kinase [Anaerolinea thermolimosa]
MISQEFKKKIIETLHLLGISSTSIRLEPLNGGCINHAARLTAGNHTFFIKWNESPPPEMFQKEARGLALIKQTNTIRVPEVLAYFDGVDRKPSPPAFILMEYIPSGKPLSSHTFKNLGEQLAQMHLHSLAPGGKFGLEEDNYLGTTLQKNQWHEDWATFFIEQRIQPQMELALRNGKLPPFRRSLLEKLIIRIPELLGNQTHQPVLLHGDLWIGNVLNDPGNHAVVIDPAVYYGDREAEIAYTQLFGGFQPEFYLSYQQVFPLEAGFEIRKDLYNLYHLLNHLNLFGEPYGLQVDSIARYLIG